MRAFDWTTVTWHRLTDELPTTQDFVDDVDGVTKQIAASARGRTRSVLTATVSSLRRTMSKSRKER